MKVFPKRFEDVFQPAERRGWSFRTNGTSDKLYKKSHGLSSWVNISFAGLTKEEGLGRFKLLQDEWDRFFFNQTIKLAWLDAVLRYKGRHIVERILVRSFPHVFSKDEMGDFGNRGTCSTELERELGRPFFPVQQSGIINRAISSYIFHFFPREFFLDHDPFADLKYFAYPFQHVNLAFLLFVYEMDERFELLQMAEDQKWSLPFFRDWVINYAYSFNLEYGKDIYILSRNKTEKNAWTISDRRRVSRVNVSKKNLEKRFKEYHKLKKEEVERLGDLVKNKSFAECFPQYVKKS